MFDSDAEGGEARASGERGGGGARRGVSGPSHTAGRQPQPTHQLPPARPWLWRHAAAPDPAWGAIGAPQDVRSEY